MENFIPISKTTGPVILVLFPLILQRFYRGEQLIFLTFRFTLGKSCFFGLVDALVSALSFLFDIKQAIGYCAEECLHLRFLDGFLAFSAFGYTAKTLIVVIDEIGRVRDLLYSHRALPPSVLKTICRDCLPLPAARRVEAVFWSSCADKTALLSYISALNRLRSL